MPDTPDMVLQNLYRDNPSDATFPRFMLSWISFRSDWFIWLSAQIVIGQKS